MLQEALTNVTRHSGAVHVSVELIVGENDLRLSITDDGHGFEVDQAAEVSKGIGILGMRERVGLLGGQLAVQSEPGQGTRLIAKLPLPALFSPLVSAAERRNAFRP